MVVCIESWRARNNEILSVISLGVTDALSLRLEFETTFNLSVC